VTFLLIATSTTNLIACMIVFFVLLVINIKNGTNTAINVVFLIVIIGVFSFFSVNELGLAAVKAKLDTSNGTSMDYSKNFLSHVVSPKDFWGDGTFNVPFPYARVRDIGILSSVLCVSFYVLLIASALKLMFSNKRTWKFIGAGCLYFLLHTLKIVQLVFLYPLLILIIFYMLMAFREMRSKEYQPSVKT